MRGHRELSSTNWLALTLILMTKPFLICKCEVLEIALVLVLVLVLFLLFALSILCPFPVAFSFFRAALVLTLLIELLTASARLHARKSKYIAQVYVHFFKDLRHVFTLPFSLFPLLSITCSFALLFPLLPPNPCSLPLWSPRSFTHSFIHNLHTCYLKFVFAFALSSSV